MTLMNGYKSSNRCMRGRDISGNDFMEMDSMFNRTKSALGNFMGIHTDY